MESTVEDCWGKASRLRGCQSLTFAIASIPPVGGNVAVAQIGSFGHKGFQGI